MTACIVGWSHGKFGKLDGETSESLIVKAASEAIAHYSEALRIKPKYADAHNNLGLALNTLGRTDEAIQEFSQVLKINPEHPVARQMLDNLRKREKAPGSGTR